MSEDSIYFGQWRLMPRTRTLVAGGERIAIGGRGVDILLALIEAAGDIVARDTLMARAWPGRIVEEGNLKVQISALRKAFGAKGPQIIVTVPGRGYRFGGSLQPAPPTTRSTAADTSTQEWSHGPSLVVLPFQVLGTEAGHADIADSIVENLITALSRIRWFHVLSSNSAFSFKGRGRELGVRYVVTGTAQYTEARIRVSVDLVETAGGITVWSDHFDRSANDLFELQDDIVGSIVVSLIEHNCRASLPVRGCSVTVACAQASNRRSVTKFGHV